MNVCYHGEHYETPCILRISCTKLVSFTRSPMVYTHLSKIFTVNYFFNNVPKFLLRDNVYNVEIVFIEILQLFSTTKKLWPKQFNIP